MSYEKHTDLQSLPVTNPYPEMPVLCTPDHFGILRIPTPTVTERPVVGSHLSSLMRRRVTGHISDSDVEVRCNKQGTVTDPSGGGRRRVVADFTSLDSLSKGRVVTSVAGQGGDMFAPVDSVINNAIQRGALNVPVVSVIDALITL